jgi:TATA-box binding protein (TBP) (component of TFIID and TFIIIB)
MLSEPNTKGDVAIKCFTNGNLHITGVKTIQRALEISEMFCCFLELTQGGTGVDDWFEITNFNVQLINAHFSFDVGLGGLNLSMLFKLLLNKTEHASFYNNERHAGVMIKILMENMKSVSIIVFDSGNVLICAFCDDEEYLIAFNFIIGFLTKHWTLVWTPSKVVKHKKSTKTLSGFDYGKYLILK